MIGIRKNKHWIADYLYIPAVFAAPKLAHFEEDKAAASICRASAGIVLGYSLMTDAKWGLFKIIPYKTHVSLDLSMGIAALAATSVIKKSSKQARTTLLLMGLTGIVVGTLSLLGARERK